MTINTAFFYEAKDDDRDVFLEAILDSINNVYKEDNKIIVETDLCNILIEENMYIMEKEYYLYLKDNESIKTNIIENYIKEEINNAVKKYQEKNLER